MKKLRLLLFAQMLLGSFGLFAQLQTLIDYGNQSFTAGSQLNTRMMVTKLTMPSGIGFDIREIGVNMHSTSLAGTLRFGFYDVNGAFLGQTPELDVHGGSEYVSFNIEPGSYEMAPNSILRIGIMTSSPDVIYGTSGSGPAPTNSGCASAYNFLFRVNNLTYPILPSTDSNWDAQTPGVLSLVVKASPLPMGNLVINEDSGTPNDGTICSGIGVSLVSPIITTGLSWNTNSTSAAISVNPTSNTNYTLTLTRGSCFVTQSQLITVLPGIVADVTISETSGQNNNDGTICSGDSAQFIATNNNTFTYNWGNSETSNVLTVSPNQTEGYSVTITDANGCGVEIGLAITVTESPNISLTQNNALCFGEEGTATLNVSGGSSFYTVQWSNGVIEQESNQTTYTNSMPAGNYTVGVHDSNMCFAVQQFTISEPNPINVSTTTNDFTISATATGTTYQWINCTTNQAIASATSQSFTATTNGDYAVIITQNGCSDTSACTTFSTIGIEELVNYFNIYPNPATSILTIESNEAIELLEILDLSGKTLVSQAKISNLHKLNIEALNRGIYMIRFTSNNQVVTKQFVKK